MIKDVIIHYGVENDVLGRGGMLVTPKQSRQLPKQKRYAALSGLAKKLIEKRGQLTNDDRTAFLEAGFEEEHLLEVVAVIAASTITNYAGKITNPPLEALLQEHAWRG